MQLHDDLPPWVEDDPTADLLARLGTARHVPVGPADPSRAALNLTVLHDAGLELVAHVTHYDRYVPVVVAAPVCREPSSPALPPELRAALTPADAQAIAQRAAEIQAARPADHETGLRHGSTRPSWAIAKLVAARYDVYANLVRAAANPLPSFAIGMVSTMLELADLSLDATGNDSMAAKALINCPAFALGAATVGLGAPLGLGVIGLIATAEDFAECATALQHLMQPLKQQLEDASRARQLAEALRRDGDARFDRAGSRFEFFDHHGGKRSCDVTDIHAERIAAREPGGDWRAEIATFERDRNGHREICFRVDMFERTAAGERHLTWEQCRQKDTGVSERVLP